MQFRFFSLPPLRRHPPLLASAGLLLVFGATALANDYGIISNGGGAVWTDTSIWSNTPPAGGPTATDNIVQVPTTGVVNGGSLRVTGFTIAGVNWNETESYTFLGNQGGGAGTFTISGNFTKSGSGSLTFRDSTDGLSLAVGGTMDVATGTLNLGVNHAVNNPLQGLSVAGTTTVGNAALNMYVVGTASFGAFVTQTGATVALNGDTASNTRNISVASLAGTGGTIASGRTPSTLVLTSNLTINGASGSTTFGGILRNSVTTGTTSAILNVAKTGASTQIFTSANLYTGATTITAGSLLANNTTGSATGTGAVSVSIAGTLGGTGIVTGPVTVDSGGTLMGGDGTTASDDLALSGNVTLNGGSAIKLTLGAAGLHSTLSRSGTAGSWVFDSAQAFTFNDLGAEVMTYQDIITGLGGDPGTTGWTIASPNYAGQFVYDDAGHVDLILTAVPEPGSLGLLVGGIAMLGFRRRRPRR
jgi:autotransporter-associated beta strand protein